jgi:hypothetical protein
LTENVVTIRLRLFLVASALLTTFDAASMQCTAESGARRVALLELYTSEGCDSCPPADRWVSSLPQHGLHPERVVTLGFHVDYWNYLGWKDPYARADYSSRQRAASQRSGARVIYTPQLLLNGRDYRRGTFKDDIDERIRTLNQEKPKARVRLKMSAGPPGALSVQGTADVTDAAERGDAHAYLAIYENNLFSQVAAGENRGKRLRHDFVVRELAGPYSTGALGTITLEHKFKFDSRWKPADLHVAVFVQNARSGDVLQALAIPNCR